MISEGRILSLPINIYWEGWRSDTHSLQKERIRKRTLKEKEMRQYGKLHTELRLAV